MFKINKEKNRVKKLKKKTFSELNMTERNHLQELIANNTDTLGEELLVIQKEFAGFLDTNERLDLLALDKDGNLVVIENKLDDTGRDVTWQIIKYASYCSTLTKNEIIKIYQEFLNKEKKNKKAESELLSFFESEDMDDLSLNEGSTSQRLILVAANFRKEITSSVLWLMKYGLKIQCIKATPYQMEEDLLLDMQQIIPVKDVEEMTIKIAEKEKEEEKKRETNRRDIQIYPIEYHTENKDKNNLIRFEKIRKYILSKDEKIVEIIRKVYIAYQHQGRNKNLFELEFKNKNVFYIKFSKELREDNFLKKHEFIEKYYANAYQRENDKGSLIFNIVSDKDIHIIKELIDYAYNKLNR